MRKDAYAAVKRGLQFWQGMLTPIAELVALKAHDMQEATLAAGRLLDALEEGADPLDHDAEAYAEALLRAGDNLATSAGRRCAFERIEDPMLRERFQSAADFNDQWFCTRDVAFRCNYLCRADGVGWECDSITLVITARHATRSTARSGA